MHLALFHAFTGCNDTVSFFSNHRKKSAWQAWQAYPEARDAFHALCSTPPGVPETVIETLAMDSVMETELTARPNTNSGLHYMPNHTLAR